LVILIALAAAISACAGVIAERRWQTARARAQQLLRLMLYVLVPFVSYVSIAHLQVTTSSTVGIALGWLTMCLTALLATWIGRSLLHLADPRLGAFVVCTVVVNTGYLGNPIIATLLGAKALRFGVAWDQLVSSPALFLLGFGIASHYGHGGVPWHRRAQRFITRNPPLWGVIAGLVASPRWAPTPLPAIAHGVVDALLVCGFFAAGVYLSSERQDEHAPLLEWPDRSVLLAIILRLGVAPVILLGLSATVIGLPAAYIVQSMMPTGLNTLVVGHAYDLDLALIAPVVVWTSLIVVLGALVAGVL
jgi:predicted permease